MPKKKTLKNTMDEEVISRRKGVRLNHSAAHVAAPEAAVLGGCSTIPTVPDMAGSSSRHLPSTNNSFKMSCPDDSVRNRRYRPRKRLSSFWSTVGIVLTVCLVYAALSQTMLSSSSSHGDSLHHFKDISIAASASGRRLLQENTDAASGSNNAGSEDTGTAAQGAATTKAPNAAKEEAKDNFPTDLFTEEQMKNGAVVLYIIGIIYMFYALALVCDEFFVPSLDVITEKLGISPDVAGATFMAAGGSAPELFTSVIGIFFAQSDVGIGTIVGSAVFNILFVIAACAFAAKEALKLTAWPLIRDTFFYSVSLILLVVFFMDNQIWWYEALILFLWYFAYVGFMKFNEQVEDMLRKCVGMQPVSRDDRLKGVTLRAAANRKGLFHLMNETINPGMLHRPRNSNNTSPEDGKMELEPLNPNPKGDKEAMMMGSQPGATGIGKLKSQLAGSAATDVSVATAKDGVNGTSKEMELKETNTEAATPKQHNNEAFAESGNTAEAAAAAGKRESVSGGGGDDDDDEEEKPIDLSFPKGAERNWKSILVYLISLPIMAPLFFTLPDTKNEKKKKWFVVTFIGSILWIAVFSYLMVWWATRTGGTMGIPDVVMGLTFLAAGTSVPDLITSVLVAKQGKGDMAVSSSVGSNIFDVCVGLPMPWLLYCAIHYENPLVSVNSEGIGCSIGLLFLMLILVFLSILIFKWQMTKAMGGLMMILYFVFVLVTLGFDCFTGWYACPFGTGPKGPDRCLAK